MPTFVQHRRSKNCGKRAPRDVRWYFSNGTSTIGTLLWRFQVYTRVYRIRNFPVPKKLYFVPLFSSPKIVLFSALYNFKFIYTLACVRRRVRKTPTFLKNPARTIQREITTAKSVNQTDDASDAYLTYSRPLYSFGLRNSAKKIPAALVQFSFHDVWKQFGCSYVGPLDEETRT